MPDLLYFLLFATFNMVFMFVIAHNQKSMFKQMESMEQLLKSNISPNNCFVDMNNLYQPQQIYPCAPKPTNID